MCRLGELTMVLFPDKKSCRLSHRKEVMMSDKQFRERERRFLQTDDIEDEVAWLRQMARMNEEKKSRIQIAAFCGHRASCIALDYTPPSYSTVEAWAEGADQIHPRLVARACTLLVFKFYQDFLTTVPALLLHLIRGALIVAAESLIELDATATISDTRAESLAEILATLAQEMGLEQGQEINQVVMHGNVHTLPMSYRLIRGIQDGMNRQRFVPAMAEAARYTKLMGYEETLSPSLRNFLNEPLLSWALLRGDSLNNLLSLLQQNE